MAVQARVAAILVALALAQSRDTAQIRSEFRGIWVDTFNTALNNHTDVNRVVASAQALHANAIFAQVRRRGDAWYLNALEPPPDLTPIESGFDPLRDLVETAHAGAIEVHAFTIVGAVWNRDPSAPGGRPSNAGHVFNRHGGYDPVAKTIVPGPDNWLTRTLLPDGTGDVSYQGHRIGSDVWIDFGHPAAAAYTVDVLMHLVRSYDIDGLHLDRIRYPEITVSGQSPSTGANIGYNPTSVARFHRRYARASTSPPPAPADPQWAQWRRDQVAAIVRRIYLNAIAIKPRIVVSAAVIAFGGGPAGDGGWTSAEAYWRVYQDWRAWMEEGILDLAIPMVYKREHDPVQAAQFNQWLDWLGPRQYGRAGLAGQGAFVNSIEGTLAQSRRALATRAGSGLAGVAFFSMATASSAVRNNPLSLPPGLDSPPRDVDELAAALTTGRSRDGRTRYEAAGIYPALFADAALVPPLAWKVAPMRGHIMGIAMGGDDAAEPLDGAAITVVDARTGQRRMTTADGGGFYGFVDLAEGPYVLVGESAGERLLATSASVSPGRVTTVNLRLRGGREKPTSIPDPVP